MPETQFVERTHLARQRSLLAIVLIAALLATHGRDAFGLASGLLVAAVGLPAREPRQIAFATSLAAVCAAVSIALH